MKNSLTILLIFFCVCSFFFANAQDSGWEFGIKANTFNTDIPDPYKNEGGGNTNVSIHKDDLFQDNYNIKSFSLGVLIKKRLGFCSLGLRIDYFKTNEAGFQTDTTSGYTYNYNTTLKENVITMSPQVEFSNEFAKTKLVYGFELPLTFYGNDNITQTVEGFSNNQLVADDIARVVLGYGTSVGLGAFAGFYYKAANKISLGAILFSSIDYYFNQQTSYEDGINISQFNPLIEQDSHEEDHLNIKAIVFEPVNLSFIISYKIK